MELINSFIEDSEFKHKHKDIDIVHITFSKYLKAVTDKRTITTLENLLVIFLTLRFTEFGSFVMTIFQKLPENLIYWPLHKKLQIMLANH